MKKVISTINSKYIHINNSVYIVQMYLESDSKIITFTLKDEVDYILNSLINENADYYFFSIYIWNIEIYKEILPKLKKSLPNCVITVGGPEVSYDSKYMLDYVDYIFRGEVNSSINEIVNCDIKSSYIEGKNTECSICNYNAFVHDIEYFDNIEIGNNQILYFETSKGCPFKCSYCMSSLETAVINLEIEKVYKLIDYAILNKVKVVKFLDRTFNVDENRVKTIMNYIIEKSLTQQSFQFEVAPELISEDLLNYLKEVKQSNFRFEVGIQSVHNETVNAVDRYHSYNKYEDTLKTLCDQTNIVTHFDLIAGLPYETLDKFRNSFNTTFKLQPDEYQLGILKILNGTKMKSEIDLHKIKYDKIAPYQFIENKYLSARDCETINLVEDIVDRFYNSKKFTNTFKVLVNKQPNMFDFIYEFALYIIKKDFKLIDYQLYDIYKIFYEFLLINNSDIADYVIYDYVCIVKNKPKRFYETLEKKQLNEVLTSLVTEEYSLNYLYKHVIVERLNLKDKVYVIKDLKTNITKIEK